MYRVCFKPIGIVHTRYSDEYIKNSWEGVDGIIEIFEEFSSGLDGIEGFSHIILLAFLHKTTEEHRKVLKVRHRRLLRFGIRIDDIPEVGVFCTDSPHRPNPIALTIVKLKKRDGRFLYVSGLDLFNETPILDIKPYTPDRIVEELELPEWYKVLKQRIIEKFGKQYSP